MGGTTLPIIFAVAALVFALVAYRGLRRGGSRFYTLERESMLRQAGYTLLGSVGLFILAVGLLVYNFNEMTAPEPTVEGNAPAAETRTTDGEVNTQPPTATPTATVDPNLPTPTVTPVVCRAVVDGTSGSGLVLRDAPGGAELAILPDGTILNLLEDAPVEANGFVWRKVRTVAREEGWVVEDFLRTGDC
jgi:hypothetical protein